MRCIELKTPMPLLMGMLVVFVLASVVWQSCATVPRVSLPVEEARVIEETAKALIAELDAWIEQMRRENRGPTDEEFGKYKAKIELVYEAIKVIKARVEVSVKLENAELLTLARSLLAMF